MKPLGVLVWNDLRILFRSGYIWASIAAFGLMLLVALQAARLDFAGYEAFIAAIILFDVVLSPVMLNGLMLLLERGEGAFAALAVTPLDRWRYLAARVLTVSLISIAEMLLLVLIVYDAALSPGMLFAGLLCAGLVASFAGIVAVAPVDSLYSFILPMILTILFLGAPGYGVLLGLKPDWLLWHPTAGALTLIEAAFQGGMRPNIAFAAASATAWIAGGALAARAALRHVEARIGGA